MIDMDKRLNKLVILIRGAGEMASGVAHRLASCHFKVCMTETSNPQAVRREVAFFGGRSSTLKKRLKG